jgi:acyl-CoA synthetase (AMP-forming)/AMP-acid ligase II
MIIRGGENISPREIEFLHTLPGVSDAEVGVPDERLGGEVVAWVSRSTGCDCASTV